jgi:hypothetical protein
VDAAEGEQPQGTDHNPSQVNGGNGGGNVGHVASPSKRAAGVCHPMMSPLKRGVFGSLTRGRLQRAACCRCICPAVCHPPALLGRPLPSSPSCCCEITPQYALSVRFVKCNGTTCSQAWLQNRRPPNPKPQRAAPTTCHSPHV